MKKLLVIAVLAVTAASVARAAPAGVAGSKHDLSALGPGKYRAMSEPSPCIFCHVSHRSGPGLNNRPEPTADHRPYESTTMSARPAAPTGASRICLSCHDGTIALGKTLTRRIAMVGTDRIASGRRSNLGTDLRSSHPVSFSPAPGKKTRAPPPADAVHLDASGQVQCTSCHDPHVEFRDPEVGMFLVKPSRGSALCVTCHDRSYEQSSHAASSANLSKGEGGPFRTVADAGCKACHDSHGADTNGRLVKPGSTDDDTCLGCHASSVTRKNLAFDVTKPWSHASRKRGVHDAAEGPEAAAQLPERSPGTARHAACVDCHDPHSARTAEAAAPAVKGAIAGVWGIDLSGRRVEPARFEYEICLKCHGDSANKPQAGAGALGDARRGADDVDLRRVFDPTSPSFHPVAAPGRNPLVPSLAPAYTTSSFVYCTDCHASDAGPGAGGAGAAGPHGSSYPHLLERRYATIDFVPESPSAYALCYKCHLRDVLLSAGSAFPLHAKHLSGTRPTSCSTCHDAHGVSGRDGNARENAHLIDFDRQIVRPGASGALRYESAGPGHGSCTVSCHGQEHSPNALVAPARY